MQHSLHQCCLIITRATRCLLFKTTLWDFTKSADISPLWTLSSAKSTLKIKLTLLFFLFFLNPLPNVLKYNKASVDQHQGSISELNTLISGDLWSFVEIAYMALRHLSPRWTIMIKYNVGPLNQCEYRRLLWNKPSHTVYLTQAYWWQKQREVHAGESIFSMLTKQWHHGTIKREKTGRQIWRH